MTADAGRVDAVESPSHLLIATVDDQLIVYDPMREQAHLLNHSAAAVWSAASSATSTGELTTLVADQFTVEPDEIDGDVQRVVLDLIDRGLLRSAPPSPDQTADEAAVPVHPPPGGTPPSPVTKPTPPQTGRGRPDASHSPSVEPSLRARALDVEITIASTHPPLTRLLTTVLDSLASGRARPGSAPPDAPPHHIAYRVEPAPEGPDDHVAVHTATGELTAGQRAADAAATLLWHYNHEAIERTARLLLLHSAAVATDDGVLALPAVANSGKSTLATALVRAGYRYVTDEALAIDPDTLEVEPYPKPIGLDPGSFPLFPDLEPTTDELPPDLFHDKWWLDPRRVSPLGADAIAPPDLPLRAVVFPTYVAEAEPTLEPVAPAEGVILLARNAFNLKRWGQQGLDLLAEIATTVPLYRMTHNDLATSLDLLYGVIGPPPRLGDDADR